MYVCVCVCSVLPTGRPHNDTHTHKHNSRETHTVPPQVTHCHLERFKDTVLFSLMQGDRQPTSPGGEWQLQLCYKMETGEEVGG